MASKSVKVAISLPRVVWKKLDALRRERGESRSALYLEALQQWLQGRERNVQVRRYGEAYRRMPETPEEVAAFEQAAASLLAAKEWGGGEAWIPSPREASFSWLLERQIWMRRQREKSWSIRR